MKNDHLIPVNIQDIINRLKGVDLSQNERFVLIQRLEAIRDFCADAVKKYGYVDVSQYWGKKK